MLDVQQAIRGRRSDPSRWHGALRMIGGLLMVVPGLFTSAVGLLLQVPLVRDLILRRMASRVRVSGARFSYGPGHDAGIDIGFGGDYPPARRQGDDVIDGEYSVQDDPPPPCARGADRPARPDAAAPWQFRLDPALSVLPRNARTREIQGECHDR